MQRNVNNLIGYRMGGTDGEIGKVEEFYFDDETWTIRYLIVLTGNWLANRKVLISPEALVRDSPAFRTFPVDLACEQIRNSPDIDTDKPVSRQQETALASYYPWQNYWFAGFTGVWGVINTAPPPAAPVSPIPPTTSVSATPILSSSTPLRQIPSAPVPGPPAADLHLRSSRQVTGYNLHTTDGEIGHIIDFILDDETWQVLYLVVDTHHLFGGRKVLIGVRHITAVQWDNSKVFVDITTDTVKGSTIFVQSEYLRPETGIPLTQGDPNIHLN
jgi:uncharacterized protein YrrD